MALINILAKSKASIKWVEFLDGFSVLNLSNIEVFPIPKELGFDYDCLGINVQSNYSDKQIVISELKTLVNFFGSYKYIELYDGIEIDGNNLAAIIDKLLPR